MLQLLPFEKQVFLYSKQTFWACVFGMAVFLWKCYGKSKHGYHAHQPDPSSMDFSELEGGALVVAFFRFNTGPVTPGKLNMGLRSLILTSHYHV